MKQTNKRKQIFWRLRSAFLIAMAVGLIRVAFPVHTLADISTSNLVQVSATVKGPAPSVAASIESPLPGQIFTSSPIGVSGTCPQSGLVIKIISNRTFVGSTICRSDETFSVKISLFKGQNTLIAQEYDALDQKGPNSLPVTVMYSPVANSPAKAVAPPHTTPLSLRVDANYSGYSKCTPGQLFNLPVRVRGGVPPYAVHIDWGDGTDKLVSLQDADQLLLATHTYNQAGIYEVAMAVSDTSGQQAILNVVILSNGPPVVAASTTNGSSGGIVFLQGYYQLFALVLLPLGFMLGKSTLVHTNTKMKNTT